MVLVMRNVDAKILLHQPRYLEDITLSQWAVQLSFGVVIFTANHSRLSSARCTLLVMKVARLVLLTKMLSFAFLTILLAAEDQFWLSFQLAIEQEVTSYSRWAPIQSIRPPLLDC